MLLVVIKCLVCYNVSTKYKGFYLFVRLLFPLDTPKSKGLVYFISATRVFLYQEWMSTL